jgi:glutaredoxin
MALLDLLYAWRRRGARPAAPTQVVLYTRRGCHLCEEVWQRLEAARRRHDFALTAVDVDTDPELADRYGLCVPVVTVNGTVRFRGAVNPVLLERLLRAGAAQVREDP